MGAVATMVVRIGADVTDLTKGMDKATKAVAVASNRIMELGKSMTLFITAPAAIAAYSFAKMAAEADSLGDRLERVFGDKAGAMKDFIADLRNTVPESTMSLTKMAIEVQNLSLNMGMSRDKALSMSEGLLKMAGDASAFSGGTLSAADALEMLEKGLAGKTRGLIQFGMVITQADIKQEAFRMGLMNTGKALTPLGTAMAAWALMQQQSSRIAGEAGRIAGEESVQFKQLKANFIDMAVKLGTLVLPAVITIVGALNSLMDAISRVNPVLLKFVLIAIGIAATVGPILSMVAGIGKLIVLVRGLVAAASAASGVLEFLAALTAPEIVLAIGAIAGAITLVVMAIKKLKGESKKDAGGVPSAANPMGTAGRGNGATSYDPETQGTAFDQLEKKAKAIAAEFQYAQQRGGSLLGFYDAASRAQERLTGYAKHGADDVKEKAVAAMRALQSVVDEKTFSKMGLGKQGGQLFGLPAMDVISRLAEKGDNLASAFENTVHQGGELSGVFNEAYRQASMLEDIIDAQPDKLGEVAVAAGRAYEKLRPLMMAGDMLGFSGTTNRKDGGGHGFNAQAAAAMQFGQSTQDYNIALKIRLELLKWPPIFKATSEAVAREGERHRQLANELALAKTQFRSLKVVMQGFEDAITAGMAQLLDMVSSASIGQRIMDKVEGAVSNFIDKSIDKTFGYVTNAIGSLFGRGKHKTGKGTPFDSLVEGMNYASTKIASSAGLRALEAQIKLQLQGNLSLEKRIELEAKLTKAQEALGEAITGATGIFNAPSGFKLALARFNATDGVSSAQLANRVSSGDTFLNGPVYIQAGSKSLKELFAELALMQKRSNKRGGNSSFQTALSGV